MVYEQSDINHDTKARKKAMIDPIERLIAMAFKEWKKGETGPQEHPSEEELACFLEGKLDEEAVGRLKEHLITCDACAELLKADLSLMPGQDMDVPQDLLEAAKAMVKRQPQSTILDLVLKLKTAGFEILSTTGDVLLGQELIPAAVLRSRNIQEFKDEVVVLKDVKDCRIEIRAQCRQAGVFGMSISAADKKTQKPLKDIRITLSKDEVELESKVSDSGKVAFEHIEPGKYSIEIAGPKENIGVISVDVR